jgi:hypothetical protein
MEHKPNDKLWVHGRRRLLKVITPIEVFVQAAALPGKASVVLQLVYFQARLAGSAKVQLSRDLLRDCCIGPKAEQRALRELEAAGLVRVHRRHKAATFVEIPNLAVNWREVKIEADETNELPEELLKGLIVKPERSNPP